MAEARTNVKLVCIFLCNPAELGQPPKVMAAPTIMAAVVFDSTGDGINDSVGLDTTGDGRVDKVGG